MFLFCFLNGRRKFASLLLLILSSLWGSFVFSFPFPSSFPLLLSFPTSLSSPSFLFFFFFYSPFSFVLYSSFLSTRSPSFVCLFSFEFFFEYFRMIKIIF